MGLCSLLAYPPAPGPNLASSLFEGLNDWPIYITPFRFAIVFLCEALTCFWTHFLHPLSLLSALYLKVSRPRSDRVEPRPSPEWTPSHAERERRPENCADNLCQQHVWGPRLPGYCWVCVCVCKGVCVCLKPTGEVWVCFTVCRSLLIANSLS